MPGKYINHMHQALKSLSETFKLNTRLFGNVLRDVDDETAQKRLNAETNNICFIALHILDARYYLAEYMGAEVENPYKERFAEVKGIDDMSDYPKMNEIMSFWGEVSEAIEKQMDRLQEEDLRRESPQEFPIEDGSILGGIAFLLQHESYHLGQLGFLRKGLLLGAMSYE